VEFDPASLYGLPRTPSDEWGGPLQFVWNSPLREQLGQLDDNLLRSWYWTLRLSEAVGLGAGGSRPPGFQWASVGMIQPDESDLGKFGVIFYTDASVSELGPSAREPISIEGNQFPVVVRTISIELHTRSIDWPRDGSVSRARTRVGTQYQREGWLTAAHVVEGADHVYYEDGSTGRVIDLAPGCIDAALTEGPEVNPNPQVLPILGAVTTGVNCTFTGKSGCYPGTVLDVCVPFGVLTASSLPARVALSQSGQPGDSGSRVDEMTTPVIGCYLGKFTRGDNGDVAGLAQAAIQLSALMQIEFLD
jgi:hypothetical protein